jgi:nicotinamide-nucleotide amidase
MNQEYMFDHERNDEIILAEKLLKKCKANSLMVATAESCTGGLIAVALTEIPGSSDVIERGFITYSNESKTELLSVPEPMIESHGAVSASVAKAMAEGALGNSRADIAISVTGIAGPGGGSEEKPVGLVYICIARTGITTQTHKYLFGDIGRSKVRIATTKVALKLAFDAI